MLSLLTSLIALGVLARCGNGGGDGAPAREPAETNGEFSAPFDLAAVEDSEHPARLEAVIGSELGTDQTVVSLTLNQAVGGVASNGTDYLVVLSGPAHDIYASRVSAAGEVLDPFGIAVATGAKPLALPSVAWTGSHYLVVWEQIDDTQAPADRNIRGARVTSAGEVLDAEGFDIAVEPLDQRAPKVVAAGDVALVVWIDGPVIEGNVDLAGRRVSGSGALLDAAPISLAVDAGEATSFDLAASDSKFLIAWERRVLPAGDAAIEARSVNEDGTTGAVFTVRATGAVQPAVGSDGSQFLVAWQDRATPRQAKIHAARVTPDGTLLDAEGFAVWPAQNGQLYPDIAFAAGHYFVTWNVDDDFLDGSDFDDETFAVTLGADDVYAVRVETTGSPVGEARAVASATHSERHPRIASSGGRVLIAWTADLRALSGQAHGARLDCCGAVLDPNGFVLATGPNAQWMPSIAYNGDVYLAVWLDHRGLSPAAEFDVWGVRYSRSGQILDPNGILIADANLDIARVEGIPRVTALGSTFLVVWPDPDPGAQPDIRAARVMGDGSVVDSGLLLGPGDVWQRYPALVSDGDRALVVWEYASQGYFDLGGVFVTNTSVGTPFSVVSNIGEQIRPTVATDGRDFLVAWEDFTSGPIADRHILATRVTKAGTALDGTGFVVNAAPGSKTDPAVAWGGGAYLVTWEEELGTEGIKAARVSAGGETLDPDGFSVAAWPEQGRHPAVAWLGSEFLVAWSGGGIRGAAVTAAGTVAEGPFSIDSANALRVGVATDTDERALVVYDDHAERTPRVWGRFVELGAPPDGGMAGAGNTGGTPGGGGTAGSGQAGAGATGPGAGGATGEAGSGATGEAGVGGEAGAEASPGTGGDAGTDSGTGMGGDAGTGADSGAGGDSGSAGDAAAAGTKGDAGGDEDDAGCSCRLPPGERGPGPTSSLAALAATALAALRRRRTERRSCRRAPAEPRGHGFQSSS